MKKVVLLLLICASAYAGPAVFVFESNGKIVEGLVSMPGGGPRALVLYFHRSIEDRSAVNAWSELLGKRGYALAGYSATGSTNYVEEARSAVAALRKQKALAALPVAAMGASLGTRAAAQWFAADPEVKALVLIVPGDAVQCMQLAKSAGRPVLMIQAENDEIVEPSDAETLRKCLPPASMLRILPGKGHRFPPSDVSETIAQWLEKSLAKNMK